MAGHTSEGLTHCGGWTSWADLGYRIISDGEGGLLWQFVCGRCDEVVRSEPFCFPSDMPDKGQGRVGSEA